MKIINNKIMCFVLLLLCNIPLLAQTNTTSILGCWEHIMSYSMEKEHGEFKKSFPTQWNDNPRYVLLVDSVGILLKPNGNKSNFEWFMNDTTLKIHESADCPWWDSYRVLYRKTEMIDTLILESHYKNPNFITRDVWTKKLITLLPASTKFVYKSLKSDLYYAYNRRVILDQKPLLISGTLKEGNKLYIKPQYFQAIQRMTTSPQLEIHVVDDEQDGVNIVRVFLVMYDESTKKINNISFVEQYYKRH